MADEKTPIALADLSEADRAALLAEARASLTHNEVIDAFAEQRKAELAETLDARAAQMQADAELTSAYRAAEIREVLTEAQRVRDHFDATLKSGAMPVSLHGQPLASGCI